MEIPEISLGENPQSSDLDDALVMKIERTRSKLREDFGVCSMFVRP